MPSAVRRSAQVLATGLPSNETPALLANADSSRLAVYFKNGKTAMLFSLACSKAGIQLTPEQTLQSIEGFAWSHLPAKFATISGNFVHIHVPFMLSGSMSRSRTGPIIPCGSAASPRPTRCSAAISSASA